MPMINAELKSLNEIQFIKKVCKGKVHKREDAKEGDTLFQYTHSNRHYFDRINSGKEHLIELTGDEPLIEVEAKRIARFAFPLPKCRHPPLQDDQFQIFI